MITLDQRTAGEWTDPHAGGGEERIARFAERERVLRSLLLDARDALVRRQLEAEGASGGEGSPAPGEPGSPAPGRPPDEAPGYQELRRRLRAALSDRLPSGSWVLVVSRGDPALLDLDPAGTAWHFPGDGDGGYAGHHPASSREAIERLEALRRRGAGFLVFPATALWWLDHYRGLARHLERRYRRCLDDPETGVVYDLRAAAAGALPRLEESAELRRPAPQRRPFAAVSIVSRNYLAQARVLARSFLEHEPEGRFYLLVVDRLPEGVAVESRVTVVDPDELEIPTFYEMCFKYGVVEFSTAVKPYLLSLLLGKYGEEVVAYFDPDILILRPLDELRDALAGGDIVLTPHILRPLPLDGKRPSEQDIMISGAYNLGFIAVRRSPETAEFLDWWETRLQDGCRIDVRNGLFTDQKWIDLVPSLFPSTVTLRDPTYNVAFWNLHERTLERNGDGFLVNGRPAAFFHVSGFNPAEPAKLSKHQTRTEVEPGSPLAALLERYAELLLKNGYEEASAWEYGYERFASGARVHPLLRQIYLNLPPEERRRFGDPFSSRGPGSFLDWATRPRPEDGGLSPFLQAIYRARYDLPISFPDVHGRDRAAFVRWARRWGSAEMKFEPELVREEEAPATAGVPGGPAEAASSASKEGSPAPGPPAMSYEAVVERIRDVARTVLPAGSRVLVVTKGDYRLVDLGGSEGWHFPQTEEGVYGGFHPPDSEVAVAHLEALREKGAEYLLIPQSALWWLEYYEGFRRHLETSYRLVVQSYDSCWIYSLRGRPARTAARTAGRLRRWLRRGLGGER